MSRCTGCEKPTTDSIVVAGLRLPYHPHCADQAWRDLRALDGIGEALLARATARVPCDGPLFRADEINA